MQLILFFFLQENDPDCESDDLEVDLSYFDEHMWPKLASRVSAFEAVKVIATDYMCMCMYAYCPSFAATAAKCLGWFL